MAGFNTIRTYNYNRSLESLRNKVDQKIYQKRMQIIQERKRAKSVRSLMDIFFNAEARERLDGDNWFDTTIKATGEWFNHNFIEWGRNPVNALLNNLGAIGDDLDYAANLVKVPLIAAAKGEDVGERLTDAYGLGDKGRISQNMSDLREALGADNPGAEIGTTTAFGALTGAEIGSKGGPIGALIGALVGTGVGLVTSSVDVGVRESGTDNGFLKGTQTVCNTISDMMMEYSADPANLFGGIGNLAEFSKNQDLVPTDTVTNLASKEPATLGAFKSSLNGERAIRPEEFYAAVYHRSAQLAQEPVKKGKQVITKTAEQQRKYVERRIKNLTHAYMNGDKKNFTKSLIETGVGKYLSDDPKTLQQQIDNIYKVLRHDANMSAIGRFGAFVNNLDAKFAHTLYRGTVPGLSLTIAKKSFMKAYKFRQDQLLDIAKKLESGEITTETLATNGSLVQKAAAQHYFKQFDKAGIKYKITSDMTPDQLKEAYKSMSDYIKIYNIKGNYREAKILQGLRNNIVLDNGTISVKLGDASYAIRALSKHNAGAIKLTAEEIDGYTDTILKLFYFEDGVDFFQDVLFDPANFKGDFKNMLSIAEPLIAKAEKIVSEDPNRNYTKQLKKIANATFKWDAFNNDVAKYYNNRLHEYVLTALENNKLTSLDAEQQRQFMDDMSNLLNNRDLDDETIERIFGYLDNAKYESEFLNAISARAYKHSLDNIDDFDEINLANFVYEDTNDTFKKMFLTRYQEKYKEARIGMALRNRYARYSNAIDNSKEITKGALERKLIKNAKSVADYKVLQGIENAHRQELFEQAAQEMINKGEISDVIKNKIVASFANTLARINKDLDLENYSSYDVINLGSTQLSAGSTKLHNIITRSKIEKPKDVDNMTDAEWFLQTYKANRELSLNIYKDNNFKPRLINNRIAKVREYINQNSNFNKTKNKDKIKFISKNIINYMLGNVDSLDKKVIKLANNIKGFNINEFTDGLDTIRKTLGSDAQWLYNSLSKSFGRDFISGSQSISDNVNKIIDILEFATQKGDTGFGVDYGATLFRGDFVDNLMQQTTFNRTVDELINSAFDYNSDSKNLYTKIFEELNIDANTRLALASIFDSLYAKRKQMIDYITDLEIKPDEMLEEFKTNASIYFKNEYNRINSDLIIQRDELLREYNELKEEYININKLETANQIHLNKIFKGDNRLSVNAKRGLQQSSARNAKRLKEINLKTAKLKSKIDTLNAKLENGYNKYADKLNKINNKITAKDLQLKAISDFKNESQELYTKLNSFTKSIFMRDVDPNNLLDKSKNDAIKYIEDIFQFQFQWSKKDSQELVDAIKLKLNELVLGNKTKVTDFYYAKEFTKNFKDSIKEISISNGKFIIHFTDSSIKSITITPEQFGKFFDNIVGIEKSYWLRNNVISKSGLNKIDPTIKIHPLNDKILKGRHAKMTNIYNSLFAKVLNNADYSLTQNEMNTLVDAINSYDNMLNDIQAYLEGSVSISDTIKLKRVGSVIPKSGVVIDDEGTIKPLQSHFVDNLNNNGNTQQVIKHEKDKIWDEPYVTNVSLKNGEIVRNSKTMQELYDENYNETFINNFNYNITDLETNTAPGPKGVDDNSEKQLYQITIRPDENNAYNIMLFHPELTNEYKMGNDDLLDADLVNGNYANLGGKLIKETDNYIMYYLNGTNYMLFKDPKRALAYTEFIYKKQGAIDENGVLHIVGHNAQQFDADVLLRYINKYNPNSSIKSIDVVDTQWLGRAVMAAEYAEDPDNFKFIDDASATLGNLYSHWIGKDDILLNAHNANADTLMNLRLAEYLKKVIGDKPNEFFKKYFTLNVNIPEDVSKSFNDFMQDIKGISLEYMILANESALKRELRQAVSEDYIINIRKQMRNEANELLDDFNKIIKHEDLDVFNNKLNDFQDKYGLYFDRSNVISDFFSEQDSLYERKLDLLHGDSRVRVGSNQRWNDTHIQDGFSSVMSDESLGNNALNDVLFIIANANNPKELAKCNKDNLTTIGYTVKGLLEQFDNNVDAFFEEFPLIKQFYGYTNRINAYIKFNNELYTILDDCVKNASPEDALKYTIAISGIESELIGSGKKGNISIDGVLQDLIKYCSIDELNDTESLKAFLKQGIESKLKAITDSNYYNMLNEDSQNRILNLINNYIDNCLNNLSEYSLTVHRFGFNGSTILRPTADSRYINLAMAALGSNSPEGILGNYQSRINPIIEETTKKARSAQQSDQEDGLINIVEALRNNLRDIDNLNRELKYATLPRSYVEQLNNKTVSQMNGLMNVYSIKSADNYTAERNIIINDRNYIYDAFDIHYDVSGMKPSTFRNVESKFYKSTADIKEIYGLNSTQMMNITDISALDNDPTYEIQKQIFINFYDNMPKTAEEEELYKRFREQIFNYKDDVIRDKTDPNKINQEEFNNLENSIKAMFGAAKMYSMKDGLNIDAKPLTLRQNLINHTTRYAEESNRMLNELFRDETGHINYALMAKYIQNNPYMKVVAMIPSDRYNNTSSYEKINYQISAEFVETGFKSPEELQQLLTHKPDTDGIRYFVVDNHNLRSLKQMIGQTTSNKTYTNRRIFNNHPHIQKLMNFRDTVAKYVLLPTKILGLQNLGFTTTNTIEGILKTLVATEGNKFKTVARYKDAIQLHRRWNDVVAKIANATRGTPFYRNKNQWDAMLKELENSKLLFNETDINIIKTLLSNNDIDGLKKLMPSVADFRNNLHDIEKVQNILQYEKNELIQKYNKLWTKDTATQADRIKTLAERYVSTTEAYNEIISDTKFTKEQFDFVNNFINSPAAAAEMQSIKKANELNLIGNKQKYAKGKKVNEDNPIDRFYKKVLFSDWGMGDNNPMKVITPYFNLSLNSDIETINRLALHMDLLDKGFTYNESYNRVLQSFFNYGDKSEGELIAELFFPFISFPFRTTLFWDQMLDENPQMIKIFADLVLTNWGKDAQNQYNQTGITKGGLKISPNLSMESGSSFLDSLVFGGNSLNVLYNRKLNPLLGPLVEGAKQLATGEANWNYRLSRLPVVSKVMYSMDLSKSLSKGKVALYDIAPSIFHKVYKDNTYYFNNQRQYQYKSIYSRLYTATGYNRWNAKTAKGRVNAIKNLYGIK